MLKAKNKMPITPNLLSIITRSKSWSDIYDEFKKYNVETDRSAGKLFEEFCQLYFKVEPSVCAEYKHIWLFSKIPPKVKLKLNLGRIDHGIDLVLEDHEGKYTVVQCKFRNNQSYLLSWSKDKIANLFADGDKADYFIIFTNCSGLDKYSLAKKSNKLKLVTLGDLHQIDPSTIETIKSLLVGKPIPVIIKQPREYQQKAISAVVDGFEKQDRGQLILPCGAGKTLISLWIKEAMKPKHTLVLVQSLALLRQTKNEWSANMGHYVPHLCVCSEKDIDNAADHIKAYPYELTGNVTTEPSEIRTFLKRHKEIIIYSTYQSLEAISEAVMSISFKFDLAICDEAHKTAGSKLGTFGLIHNDKNVSVNKRLYMTATPRIISAQLKSKAKEDILEYLCDMSNPAIFGPEFYRMSFKEAIDQKILVDYKIIAMGVSDVELQQAIENRRYVADGETIDEVANNYALEKFMHKNWASHAITFHSTVKKAKAFRDRNLELYSDVEVFHVNGQQTTNDRNVEMEKFKNAQKSIMTNSRCLTEGVDVPAIDIVYFCDPKNSKIDIVQASGRALRRADDQGKQYGYIVVPIFHREKDKLNDMINKGPFGNLIDVIKALSSQDERLVDEIRQIKIGKGKLRARSIPFKIDYGCDLITLEGFEDRLKNTLFTQIVEQSPIPWRQFEIAREYIRNLGLKSFKDWMNYSAIQKPIDIPSNPQRQYKNKGWKSWSDWLGTRNISSHKREFLSFEEAKRYAISLKLKSGEEWEKHAKRGLLPLNIPANPEQTYRGKGWKTWGDWLGTKTIANKLKKYRSFEEARAFIRSIGLKSQREWQNFYKSDVMPEDIPTSPERIYKNKGWVSLGDWLGTFAIAPREKEYRHFEDAREFVRGLKLNTVAEWRTYSKTLEKPEDIPASPYQTYKDNGWISYSDWLGNNRIANRNRTYRTYQNAQKYIHGLNLKSQSDWNKFCDSGNMPDDIPRAPHVVYKNKGWNSWSNWLGSNVIATQAREYLSYKEAQKVVSRLELKSTAEWKQYCKSGNKPENIPAAPHQTYKGKGWDSYGIWLGTGTVAPQNMVYRSFEDARSFVHGLNLKNGEEWREYCKSGEKPNDIPAYPNERYKKEGWVSWGDWFGKK